MSTERGIALGLAANLQRLMDHYGLSQAELARRSGVAQRTISTLLNDEDPNASNPRAKTLEQLATYFGIPAWQLLVPDMPLELLVSHQLTKLVENYRDAPDEGRATVDRIAQSEVRYANTVSGEARKTGTGGT